jgi:membrane protein implicated in regulation of membrane protease activity
MLLRSEPSKDPERTQIWERLNSFITSIFGSHTFIVACAPYISLDVPVYAIACYSWIHILYWLQLIRMKREKENDEERERGEEEDKGRVGWDPPLLV